MQPIRRQQLIDATLAAVNEVGMHDATIVQIARRAGVSNGIISHYFKDKNGLLEATMRYLISHLGEAVKLRLQALTDNSPAARLQAIVAGNFDDSQINSAAMKTRWPFGQQSAPTAAQPAAAGERPPALFQPVRRVSPRDAAAAGAVGGQGAGGADRRTVAAQRAARLGVQSVAGAGAHDRIHHVPTWGRRRPEDNKRSYVPFWLAEALYSWRLCRQHRWKTFNAINPANGEVLAEVQSAGAEDVDRAVASAPAGRRCGRR